MANELVIENGLIVRSNIVVTGSVRANSFTGSFFGTSSFASTSSYLNSGVVRLIRKNGQVVEYLGNTPTDCGFGMVNAQIAAVSGDTIHVHGDALVTSSFGKNGVNWWFAPGVKVLRTNDADGNIFDDGGTNMSFSVMGHGHFERFLSDQVELSSPGDSGVFKQSGPLSVIDIAFETIYLTSNNTGESATAFYVGDGICRPNGNRIFITGSATGGSGLWWENGEVNGFINEIINDGECTFLIYNHVSDTPTGELRLYINKIDTGTINGLVPNGRFAIDNNVSTPDAASWFFVNTIRGFVSSVGGKLYIIGQKLIGRSLIQGGKTYIDLQKVGGDLQSANPYIALIGGTSWINVNQFEPGINSRELISASFGTHFINAQDLTSSGSSAIAVGGSGNSAVVNLLSGVISSSGAGVADLKRVSGTLNVSSEVIYNSAKTSGSITLLPIYGTNELAGISNLSSGSTGIVKRNSQGVYSIATASVDYLSPTASLFFGTSSWAITSSNAVSASRAITSSFSVTSSFVTASGIGGILPIDKGGTNSKTGTTPGTTIQDTGVLYRSGNQIVTTNNPGNLYLTFDGFSLAASAATFGNTTSMSNMNVGGAATFNQGLTVLAGQGIVDGGFYTTGNNLAFGPGGSSVASPYFYTDLTSISPSVLTYNYNGAGNNGPIALFQFFSADSSLSTAMGYMRVDDTGGSLNFVFGSNDTDRVSINCTSGKIHADGGIDPPFVLYDAHTRQETKDRVLREVPSRKYNGAALFYNPANHKLETYIASEDKFYDLLGNEIPNALEDKP